MKKQRKDLIYNTKLEKKIIDELGMHSSLPRVVLLGKYLHSCLYRRTNWHGLNKDAVIKYIRQSIDKCHKKK